MSRLRAWAGVCVVFVLMAGGCTSNKTVRREIEPKYAIEDPAFVSTMGNLLGPGLLQGNVIQPLENGNEIFPAMLSAIRSAEKTITFETFVYWRGEIGREFADALAERARAGVKVHAIIDWLGADRIDERYIEELKKAGADVERYHAIHWYNLPGTAHIDNRTHRKILVVDGKVAFTGGVGIADEWKGDARNPKEYRDNHYRIEGPVVAQLQAAFMDNWMKTTGAVLHGPDYFPVLAKASEQGVTAQVFKSSYDGGSNSMQLLYLLSVAAAKAHVRLASAYFIPDEQTSRALLAARRRGVVVDILVPGKHIDEEEVRDASRARWGDLLKAGVRIWEYEPTMYHVKQAIFDDRWVTVGSSNLDDRSFRLNDEVNLNVLDERFAREEAARFDHDLERAKPVTYEAWRHRPLLGRMREGFWTLISHEL